MTVALQPSGAACTRPDCFAPEVACNLGHDDYRACPFWARAKGEGGARTTDSATELAQADVGESLAWHAPWSGSALGLADLDLVAARGVPRIVGLVGLENAGKTTLLGAVYLALCRSGQVGSDLFAGSFTLGGWEAVAAGMRWKGPGSPPGFPPHTPRTVARAPGMLHLGLRRPNGMLADVLVTDAPGEWFRRWSVQREAPDAAGARWVARYADAFLLALDGEALAHPTTRGEARVATTALIQRLGSEAGRRPVAVVWTKADVEIPARIRDVVEDAVRRFLPEATRFAVTVEQRHHDSVEFVEVLRWACDSDTDPDVVSSTVGQESAAGGAAAEASEPTHLDPFFAYRVAPAPARQRRGLRTGSEEG